MSVMQSEELNCPACNAPVTFNVAYSVNADRRPDLRAGILDGSFQQEICGECGAVFRLQPSMSYLDVARNQWLLVRPVDKLADWPEFEEVARVSFEDSYGPDQSQIMQKFGSTLQSRVTFGWAAFREKLLAAELGLDDVVLEMVKIALIRGLDDCPLSDTTELRLLDLVDDELVLAWIRLPEEKIVETLRMPRAFYDEIAADREAWQPLRDQLTAGRFVDLHRLLVAPAAAE